MLFFSVHHIDVNSAKNAPCACILLHLLYRYDFLEDSILPADTTESRKRQHHQVLLEAVPAFSMFRDFLKRKVMR